MASSPEPGYERPAQPLGRSSRRPIAVVAVTAVFLAVVFLKPWAGTPNPPPDNAHPQAVAASSTPPTAGPPVPRRIAPAPTPPWPASAEEVPGSPAPVTDARLADLARHAGAWGVWVAGDGPRLIRDDPWTAWVAVRPEPSQATPLHVTMWPGTGICDRVPELDGTPSAVAVTMPARPPAGWRVYGWWTDGGRVARLDGSLEAVVPSTVEDVFLIVRVDGERWPPGRYELHVATGPSTTALTFCLRPAA
jgi:hypothetical protein